MSAPMPLGPFLVAPDGTLDLRCAGSSNFSFIWRKRRFFVRVSSPQLTMTTALGRIPSTAVSQAQRVAALRVLAPLRLCLPGGSALRLLPDHRIQLELQQPMEWPNSISQLLAPVVAVLLRAAPVLDFADESGLA